MIKTTRNNKVLLLDTNHEVLEKKLLAAGFQCDYFEQLTFDELKKIIGDYSGIIVRSRFLLNKELLQLAGNLSFIGRVGAGMEGIDIDFAAEAGIQCFNAPEGNRNAVGEHALGMLLALMNKMLIIDKEVRSGIWKREENRGTEIEGKTIAIIGYGNTGSSFARKLAGFDCHVLAYDKYKTAFSDQYATESSMADIFRLADILSLHVPLTAETNYLVNKKYLNSFERNIILINTSRGKVVNTDDLVKALDSEKVTAAALDVLEYENLSFEDLQESELPQAFRALALSDKVILSPHVAGWTHESKLKLAEVIVAKILSSFAPPTV